MAVVGSGGTGCTFSGDPDDDLGLPTSAKGIHVHHPHRPEPQSGGLVPLLAVVQPRLLEGEVLHRFDLP